MTKNLLIDGVKFNLWKPKSEVKDFEPIIKEHSKEIFGKNSLYFDIKPELRSNAGIGSKPDGFVIAFDNPAFYVVEVERAEHGVHDHVVTQISKFNSALKKAETKTRIVKAIYDDIKSDPEKEAFTKKKTKDEPYKYLTELVSSPPTVIIVVDELLDELRDAVEELPLKSKIVQFQTFQREDAPTVHAHLFEPLFSVEETSEERKKEYPERLTNYEVMLAWVDPNTRVIANELRSKISELPQVKTVPHGRNLCFYRGKPTTKSVFAAYLLRQKAVGVRIRTDPTKLKDPQKLTGDRVYRGWFFKQNQEKQFKITDKSQIPYAIELIKQSYELAESEA